MPKPIQAIKTNCYYCNRQIWAQADNSYPECEICFEIAVMTFHYLDEVEETLVPITEHAYLERGVEDTE